jgi:hypothetical protein
VETNVHYRFPASPGGPQNLPPKSPDLKTFIFTPVMAYEISGVMSTKLPIKSYIDPFRFGCCDLCEEQVY